MTATATYNAAARALDLAAITMNHNTPAYAEAVATYNAAREAYAAAWNARKGG